jgi:hypothetical protein
MPNWCSNYISISGPKELIAPLWGAMNEKQGLLEAIKPIGEWDYYKAVQEWGTKWDVDTRDLQVQDISGGRMEISGSFDSAWSPPIEALQHLADQDENISISLDYFEPGMAFCGNWSSAEGDKFYEIDPDNLDEIPEDLREMWNIDEFYEQLEDGEEEDSDLESFADAYPVEMDENGTPIEDEEDY